MFSTGVVIAPRDNAHTEQLDDRLFKDDRDEFVEPVRCRTRGARGVFTGIVLGAGLWGAILVLTGVIKL